MADTDFQDLQLVGRRVPDYSLEVDATGHKYQQELPGTFEVGFMVEGVFRAIHTMKAAGLLADIARAQQSKAAQQSQPDAEQSQPDAETQQPTQ